MQRPVDPETFEWIRVEERDSIAIVRLNRPEKLNAWHPGMQIELNAYLDSLNEGAYRVRAVVLTGEGRAFCAGGDVQTFPGADLEARRPPWRTAHPEAYAVRHMRNCDVPIIGAINGYAVGMGFGVALATDLRIAAADATFQVAQTLRGIVADFGLSYFLPRAVGTQRALELMLTGRRIPAEEALALGLVLEVVPPAELLPHAVALAERVAAGPPLGMAASKHLVYMVEDPDLQRTQDLTAMYVKQLFVTEDGIEGVRSFQERRAPRFAGR